MFTENKSEETGGAVYNDGTMRLASRRACMQCPNNAIVSRNSSRSLPTGFVDAQVLALFLDVGDMVIN